MNTDNQRDGTLVSPQPAVLADKVVDAVRVYLVKFGLDSAEATTMSQQVVSQLLVDDTTDVRTRISLAINQAIASLRQCPRHQAKTPRAVPPSAHRNMPAAKPYALAEALQVATWLPAPSHPTVLVRPNA